MSINLERRYIFLIMPSSKMLYTVAIVIKIKMLNVLIQ